MTREKAAEEVRCAFDVWKYDRCTGDDWSDAHEARDMAVKALTEESIPVEWIEAEIKSLKNENSYTSYHLSECYKALLLKWKRVKNGKTG